VICFDPDDLSEINLSDDELDVSNSAEDIFHILCGKVNSSVVEITKPTHALCQTFDRACKSRYENELFCSPDPCRS